MYNDGQYFQNNPTWDVEHSPWKAQNIFNLLNKHKLHPKTICEVGCGAGEILNSLYRIMDNPVIFSGYDISKQAISLAKAKENERLKFFDSDVFEGSRHYDVVLAIDVIEHVEDYFSFLRKLRVLGEYKIFHIPLEASVQLLLRVSPIMETRRKMGHLHIFTKEIALELLKDAGYEVVDVCYTFGSLELPGKSLKSKLLRLPRKIFYFANNDFAVRLLGGFSLMVLAK